MDYRTILVILLFSVTAFSPGQNQRAGFRISLAGVEYRGDSCLAMVKGVLVNDGKKAIEVSTNIASRPFYSNSWNIYIMCGPDTLETGIYHQASRFILYPSGGKFKKIGKGKFYDFTIPINLDDLYYVGSDKKFVLPSKGNYQIQLEVGFPEGDHWGNLKSNILDFTVEK